MTTLSERPSGLGESLDAEVGETRDRAPSGLVGRDLAVTATAALAFLAAAAVLAALAPAAGVPSWPTIVLLVVTYAAFTRVEFEVGSGALVPTQLLLVPMLFLLPTALVPLAVAAGLVLGSSVDLATGRLHASRLLVSVVYSSHALGPAIVLVAAGIDRPSWEDWPWLVAAFGAQVAFEIVSALVREVLGVGVPARVIVGAVAQTSAMDLLLAPVGLTVAIVADETPAAVLAAVPLAVLFRVLAFERRARIDRAVALSDAVENASRAARTDVLTGLANRLAWEEALVDVAARPLVGVVLGDVDGLKHVNDTFGHETGDELIQTVAAAIRDTAGARAVLVARLGGDEFGCLLLGTDAARCEELAGELGRAIDALPPIRPGAPVSASFGAATAAAAGSLGAAIEEADRLAYVEKAARGRGRRAASAA